VLVWNESLAWPLCRTSCSSVSFYYVSWMWKTDLNFDILSTLSNLHSSRCRGLIKKLIIIKGNSFLVCNSKLYHRRRYSPDMSPFSPLHVCTAYFSMMHFNTIALLFINVLGGVSPWWFPDQSFVLRYLIFFTLVFLTILLKTLENFVLQSSTFPLLHHVS
jgi:hypothetical protein